MGTLIEIFNPSFLLFPALVGSVILGAVSPLVGAYLVLRRTVLLGLTLPQIAAAGIAFTFLLQHGGILGRFGWGDRVTGTVGSMIFTFAGMAVLGYLDRRGRGLTEGRLAAAYALAGALTILFIVFNPSGEIEIISLLKGEVIALSYAELRLLGAVFLAVSTGMVLFRREFLLTSFDRDLAFLLKGGTALWEILLYLLAGITIAIGVIMAGPLLLFGFLVLPPLAARPLVKGMSAFLSLSLVIGIAMAVFGFYLSYRLDLPLGPTDVTLGCGLVFAAHALRRALKIGTMICLLFALLVAASGCSSKSFVPLSDFQQVKESTVWIARVKNSTDSSPRLPGTNPLRSLAEMAGKVSPESRPTVMGLLRESLREEFDRRGLKVFYPEVNDSRLSSFPSSAERAAMAAREGLLTGYLLLTEIQRWSANAREFIRVSVDFRLIRIADGCIAWKRRIQRAIPTLSATHAGEVYRDAVEAVVHDIFEAP